MIEYSEEIDVIVPVQVNLIKLQIWKLNFHLKFESLKLDITKYETLSMF